MLIRVSLVLLYWFCVWIRGQQLDSDSWADQAVLSDGVCRYGNSVECCWGWRQVDWGRCQPHCQQGCKHGECVGPDRCRCHRGYTGKACNHDLNECGVKPRPCKHRCVNTAGSYRCYCLDGYAVQPDGSCRNARTCYHANCQYGCEVMKGAVRCTCPSPGLRLGPDRRTCIDIDECVRAGGACPRRRKCVNTFGSFLCKCHVGFRLVYINGRYTCTDKDTRPFCSLNPSSPKCRCEDGSCRAVLKVTLEPQRPRTTRTTTPITTTAAATAATTTTNTTPTTAATTTTTTTATAATTTTATTTTPTTATAATTTTPTTATAATTTTPTTATNTTTAAATTATTTTNTTTAAATTATTTNTTTATAATTTTTTPTPTTATTTTTTTTTTATTTTPTTATTTTPTTATAATTTTPTTATTTTPTTATTTTPTTATTTTPTTATTTTPTTATAATTTTPTAATTTTTNTTTATAATATTTTATTTTNTTTATNPPTTTTTTTSSTTPATTTAASTTTTTLDTSIATATTPPTATTATTTVEATTVSNRINKHVTHRQRGDVHIPRRPGHSQMWEFDIELGNTAEDARDDPAVGELHCSFDHGLCDWISDREGDLHWTTALTPTGGRYLSVQEQKAGQRSILGARLAVQIPPPWSRGDLCYSFSHWLTGHHVGVLQLFVRTKGRDQRYSSALWSRTGGHGWRHTQVTLTTRSVDKVLLKAERRKGRRGLIAVDDVTLRRGACR